MALLMAGGLVGCSALVDTDDTRLGGDETPTCAGGCDDGVECTVDRCMDGVCVNERDPSRCGAGERCDAMAGCVDNRCGGDSECDDGLRCNGVERCEAGVCMDGLPVGCDDGIACTVDLCDEATGECNSEPNDGRCDDGVPCTVDSCGAAGCTNAPNDAACDDGFCAAGGRCTADGCVEGTVRSCDDGTGCTADRCDSDLMMCVSEMIDADEDGFGPVALCGPGNDCDDERGDVFPGAEEVCDRVDQDCDGNVDEGVCDPVLPDTCETAQELTVIGGGISVTANFARYENDYTSPCNPTRGADAVFVLNLESGIDYVLDTEGSVADTVLAVSDTCGTWEFAGRGCNDDARTGVGDTDSRLFLRGLGSSGGVRTLYILVDRYGDTAAEASFTLNVTPMPATGATCGEGLDISAGGTVVGHIGEGARADRRGSCNSLAFREREHYFTLRARGSRTAVEMYSDDFAPTVYAATGCDRFFSQAACDNDDAGRSASIEFDNSAESYRIVADGADPAGFYSLDYI